MPRYDYRCTGCGNEFELRQTFSEAGRGTCPLCSGAGQRVFHAVPIIYKGSGFYTTDYGRPKRQEESGSKDSKDGDKASSTAASSDKAASSETSSKESSGTGSSSNSDTKAESAPKTASETSG